MFFVYRRIESPKSWILLPLKDQATAAHGAPASRSYGHETLELAQARAALVEARTEIRELESESEARMLIDPACIGLRKPGTELP